MMRMFTYFFKILELFVYKQIANCENIFVSISPSPKLYSFRLWLLVNRAWVSCFKSIVRSARSLFSILSFALMAATSTVEARSRLCTGSAVGGSKLSGTAGSVCLLLKTLGCHHFPSLHKYLRQCHWKGWPALWSTGVFSSPLCPEKNFSTSLNFIMCPGFICHLVPLSSCAGEWLGTTLNWECT